MDLKDYDGVYKYKFFAPTLLIIGAFTCLVGPILFPTVAEYYTFVWILFAFIKFITSTISLLVSVVLQNSVIQKMQAPPTLFEEEKLFLRASKNLQFGFIIPSYKQEQELICETVERLSKHPYAKDRYIIILAMEKHEEGSDIKAEKIIAKFKNCFAVIDYTRHEIQFDYEQKGKASNVSWAVRHLEPILEKNNIVKSDVFLTIQDVDSWAPKEYISLVEEQIYKNYDARHKTMFCPPFIFGRNRLQVPVFVRVFDDVYAYGHYTNLITASKLAFPMSNYTMSYQLIKKIGFWDINADAIGEDVHTMVKAFYKTGGEFQTIPIFAPFNQLNICTGQGFWEDVKSKWWQCQRHLQGCSDIAYGIKRLTENIFSLRQWVLFYSLLQTFFIQITMPTIFFSFALYDYILKDVVTIHRGPIVNLAAVMLNILGVSTLFFMPISEYIRQKTNYHFYKRTDQSLIRGIIQTNILTIVNLIFFLVPASYYSCFKVLGKNREYTVAKKASYDKPKIGDEANIISNENLVSDQITQQQL